MDKPSDPPRWLAVAALALGVLCIGWSAIFVRWAAAAPGPASAFYRAAMASAVLIPVWIARRSSRQSRPPFALAALAGLFFALDLASYNTAVLDTSAAMGTLLGNISPFCVGFATWFLFRRRPDRVFWYGLTIALIGVVMIVGTDIGAHPALGFGDFLGVMAGMWFAGFLVTTERARVGADTLSLTTLSIASSAVVLFVICLLTRSPLTGYPPSTWAALVALALVTQVIGYLALTYALGHLPATLTSVVLLLQAPLTALLAFPLLGERLTVPEIVGGLLVLLGVYVVVRPTPSFPARHAQEDPAGA